MAEFLGRRADGGAAESAVMSPAGDRNDLI